MFLAKLKMVKSFIKVTKRIYYMLYLVTDPCYLLDLDPKNKDRVWNLCIDDMDNFKNSL